VFQLAASATTCCRVFAPGEMKSIPDTCWEIASASSGVSVVVLPKP
jgi:hypothetical protein